MFFCFKVKKIKLIVSVLWFTQHTKLSSLFIPRRIFTCTDKLRLYSWCPHLNEFVSEWTHISWAGEASEGLNGSESQLQRRGGAEHEALKQRNEGWRRQTSVSHWFQCIKKLLGWQNICISGMVCVKPFKSPVLASVFNVSSTLTWVVWCPLQPSFRVSPSVSMNDFTWGSSLQEPWDLWHSW